MIIISNVFINNKFLYNNNINKTIHVYRTSETINKLIQYDLNNKNDDIFNIIDIEFIFLLIDINELALLKKIKIKQSDFNLLQRYTYTGINKKYDKINLYTIFEKLYSSFDANYKSYYLIGSKITKFYCIYHRENDLPAIILSNGTKKWFKNGRIHRENNLPACIYANGDKHWYKNGFLHRDNDLPAVIYANGTKAWYKNGNFHRDNDLPAVIYNNGDKEWYKNGLYHRDNDLPAFTSFTGTKEWYKNDKLHRDNDLPAIIYCNGTKKWYKNGINYKL